VHAALGGSELWLLYIARLLHHLDKITPASINARPHP
jgi:hypothetical protein